MVVHARMEGAMFNLRRECTDVFPVRENSKDVRSKAYPRCQRTVKLTQ